MINSRVIGNFMLDIYTRLREVIIVDKKEPY